MGCRGPSEDANLKAYIKALEDRGFKRDQIEKRIHTYAGFVVDDMEKKAGSLHRADEL